MPERQIENEALRMEKALVRPLTVLNSQFSILNLPPQEATNA
jgi:hypothetical protein